MDDYGKSNGVVQIVGICCQNSKSDLLQGINIKALTNFF